MSNYLRPHRYLLILLAVCAPLNVNAELTLPALFGDHMVLQRDYPNPAWGKTDPNETVSVSIAGQTQTTTADADGAWKVLLDPIPVGGPYTLTVSAADTEVVFSDVLVGEVWLCSGQSNMYWPLAWIHFADLEIATANHPEVRLITVGTNGTQTPQFSFEGQWQTCTPETAARFSALAYLFGKRLQDALDVPVGLIHNSWGGASIEGWIPREKFAVDAYHTRLLKDWDERTAAYTDADWQAALADYENERRQWEAGDKQGRAPRKPQDPRTSRNRPANIFNGMIAPMIDYGIAGVIWYQGESNVSHAWHYRTSFPLMIESWREAWGRDDLPFYWIQLPNHGIPSDESGESEWAELREAQTLALRLPHTGQVVTIDTSEGRNLHPRNKQIVADRLVQLVLARQYGWRLNAEYPAFASMEIADGKIILTFTEIDLGLYAYATQEPLGFAIAGEDGAFVRAQAAIIARNKIAVWSDDVPAPVAVRYAWANNPVANIQDRNGLPLTPFRTDERAPLTRHD